MYIQGTYQYETPVLVHTAYILFLIFRTIIYQYVLGMYWYEHFWGVSSRVSGFQMCTLISYVYTMYKHVQDVPREQ